MQEIKDGAIDTIVDKEKKIFHTRVFCNSARRRKFSGRTFVETPSPKELVEFQLAGGGMYRPTFSSHLIAEQTNDNRISSTAESADQTDPVKHRSLPWEVVPNSSLDAVSEDATTGAAEDEGPSESTEEDLEHEAEAVQVKEEEVIDDTLVIKA